MRASGFTLVELLIGLAVMTLLLTAGIPATQQFLASQRVVTAVNQLTTELALARSAALLRTVDVTACPDTGSQTCGTWRDWGNGLLIFVDSNGNNAYDAATEPLIRASGSFNVQIRTTVGRPRIKFQASGMALGFNATFTLCALSELAPPKAVILSSQGRSRVAPHNSDGSPLSCT